MSGSIKFLLFLVVALIVAIGSLWFVGGKQREFSTSVTIDVPASRVFSELIDLGQAPQWRSEIEQIQPLGDGELQVGSQFASTLRFGDHSDEYIEEVLRLKSNELFSMRGTSDRAVVNTVFKLESVDSDETRLTYKLKMTSRGIARVLTPFADDTPLKEVLEANALSLKKMIESEGAAEASALSSLEPSSASPTESLEAVPPAPDSLGDDGASSIDADRDQNRSDEETEDDDHENEVPATGDDGV